MADKFPPAKGPKVPPMQPRIIINIGESASSAQLRRLIRDRHAAWSQETFGDVGPIGPLKHLAKESLEAAAAPDDLSEWADLQFLLWDAQRRAGISDGEITAAMEEKLKVNMARQWPEPKDGEPRQHIKPAPVTIDERASFNAWNNGDNLPIAGVGAKNAAWLAWQARARLGSPSAPVVPDDGRDQFEEWMLNKWGRERQEYDFRKAKFFHGENYADLYTRCMWGAWTASRAAMQSGGKS